MSRVNDNNNNDSNNNNNNNSSISKPYNALETLTGLNAIIRKADVDTNDINYEYIDGIPHDERFKDYVNIGYENWRTLNKEWRNPPESSLSSAYIKQQQQQPMDLDNEIRNRSIDAMRVTQELINHNGAFTYKVPLSDLVSILVEEWEIEELDMK